MEENEKKKIIVNRFELDYIYADINKVQELFSLKEKDEKKEQQKNHSLLTLNYILFLFHIK